MKRRGLDAVIHAPSRLQICALLTPLEEAEFQLLRETVGISDSVLSKQIKYLEEAGYVTLRKGVANGRPRTWVGLTGQGRRAFAAHVAALQAIVAPARS